MLGILVNGTAGGVSTQGLLYSGAVPDKALSGKSAFISSLCKTIKRSSAMVSPTIAKSKSHLSNTSRASASNSGLRTISMRS